jgi:hypothetical protein
VGDNQILVIKRDTDDANINYRVFMGTTGTINFFGSNGATAIFNLTTTATLSAGTIYHIAVVKSSTGGATIYINGASSVTDGAATGAVGTTTDPLRIGTRFRPTAQLFADGVVDEVGFWTRVLSSSEVSQLYTSGAGLAYPFSSSTTIKTIDGVTRANVKTFLGVASASIKTINGIT